MNADKKNACGKRSYSKRGARTAKNRRRKKGVLLRIYHCPNCNWWHLTHHV